jgi:hypothetical protein
MTNFDSVKDSGQRRSFDTGSVRDVRTGKGRYDLLSPVALARLAKHTENGATKYGDRNWEKGQPIMSYIDSALRHLFKHIEGHRDEDHLAAALWNIAGVIHTEEMINRALLPAGLDDRPDYTPKPHKPDPTVRSQTKRMAQQLAVDGKPILLDGDCF